MSFGRWSASALNWLIPGKRRAAFLLVANARPGAPCRRCLHANRRAGRKRCRSSVWRPEGEPAAPAQPQAAVTFLFLGRLVDWKSVDLLLLAFQRAASQATIRLVIAGDGVERQRLQALADELDSARAGRIPGSVTFTGWLSQAQAAAQLRLADCLVLPSILDCGGAVVLEAMCVANPSLRPPGVARRTTSTNLRLLVTPPAAKSSYRGLADAMIAYCALPADAANDGRPRPRESARRVRLGDQSRSGAGDLSASSRARRSASPGSVRAS